MNFFKTAIHTPRIDALRERIQAHSTVSLALGAVFLVSAGSGCTDHEAKATQAIEQAVQTCRDVPAEQTFYAFERFDGKQDEILRVACLQEIENFEIINNLTASASTGPVIWNADRSQESGTWSVASVEWPDLERARRALNESDPTQEQLTYATEHLASAQKAVPESAWLRLSRLDALLKLRSKSRSGKTPDPTSIGAEAQAQFEETLKWAKENDDLDTEVEAQYMVVRHLQKYLNRVEMILEADGSGDEWLIKSAEVAEKEGRTEEAEAYRKELDETQQKRAEDQKIYGERQVKLRATVCAQLSKLSPAGVEDTDLQQKVTAQKSSLDCMKRAEAPRED